jgi:hypothetical protein
MKSGNAKPDARTISYGTESASRKFLFLLSGMTITIRDTAILSPTIATGATIRATARLAFKSR